MGSGPISAFFGAERQPSVSGNGQAAPSRPYELGRSLPVRAAHRYRAARVPSARMPHQPPTPFPTPAEPSRPATRGGDCPLHALPSTNNLRSAPVRLVLGNA